MGVSQVQSYQQEAEIDLRVRLEFAACEVLKPSPGIEGSLTQAVENRPRKFEADGRSRESSKPEA
jgi:hypothetical protein